MTKEQLACTIGKNIARKCKERKISQKDLAEQSGLTEAGISRYISGQRLPRLDILLKIADVLHCSLDYLLYSLE
jgi:transcriptional regulator with XRE-family HTH domain